MEHYVCERADLEEKKTFLTDINGMVIGVIFFRDGIYAYENRCPHMEGPVCLGDVRGKVKTRLNDNKETCGEYESLEDVNIVCPWHGLEFDVVTGRCIPEPGFSLRSFETFVREEKVYIKI